MKVQEEIRKEVEDEYGLDEAQKLKQLTIGEAERHMEKIRLFNDKVIAAFSEINQQTGKRMIRMNERGFEIMIQKEKDKFYLETGLTPEQVQKFIRQHQLAQMDTQTLK